MSTATDDINLTMTNTSEGKQLLKGAGGQTKRSSMSQAQPTRPMLAKEWWKMFIVEFIGTATLVFMGCGTATTNNQQLSGLATNVLTIAMAFGIAIIAMAYGIGSVSGCHVNPAVSLGVCLAGRMHVVMMLIYWVAQFLGGLVGAGALYSVLLSKTNFKSTKEYIVGANGWGVYEANCTAVNCTGMINVTYGAGYSMGGAFGMEVITTFLFLVVILGVTGRHGLGRFAGLAIGFTLVGIHTLSVPVTGTSVNPARSFGPAVVSGGLAMKQVWLFFIAPWIGAAIAGICYRIGLFELSGDKQD